MRQVAPGCCDAIGVSDSVARAASSGRPATPCGGAAAIPVRDVRVRVARLAGRGRPAIVVMLERAVGRGRAGRRRLAAAAHHPFVIDCTGRAGVIARQKNLREYDDGPRTVALVGVWRREGDWPVPDDTHTLIESYDDGWMWSVPAAGGVRHIAAMVDPQRSDLARGGSAKDVYLAEIAKTHVFSRLISDASLLHNPRGWDASQYRAREYAGDGWLLAGDAGSFVDRCRRWRQEGAGVGWLAAIVAHTACSIDRCGRTRRLL